MKKHFVNNSSKELIVFFCGWGMDETPFKVCEPKDKDILYLYDYSDPGIKFDFSKYSKKTLIAFSYGVFIAGLIQFQLPEFDQKIAVNGTLKPIDRDFGIPEKIFDLTLHSMSGNTMKTFHKKMFDNNLDYEYFEEHLPNRSLENCFSELEKIREYAHFNKKLELEFDKILISQNDNIISPKNQLKYWGDNNIKMVNAGHFLFYKFTDFDEIINL